MLRLFVALDPPEEAREAVASWRDALVAGRPELRPVAAAGLHVTLAFLGSRPASDVAVVWAATESACAGLSAPLLTPAGVRGVPSSGRARLFALDLEDAGRRSAVIAASLSSSLASSAGYEPEKRPFWPHITLARVRRGARAEPLAAGGPLPPPFMAGAVVLYRSRPSPHGARYEPLRRLDLG